LGLGLLGLVGLGFGVVVAPHGPERLRTVLWLSPVLGFTLLQIIGFPLVRFVAPLATWAMPLALILSAASLAWLFRDYRRHRAEYKNGQHPRAILVTWLAPVMVALGLGLGLWRGANYAVYRSNSSDAYLYMSLAETLRAAPWEIIRQGAALTASNEAGLAALARLSPTALFAARFVWAPGLEPHFPQALNNPITMGWLAQVLRQQTVDFYYPYHLLCLALAFGPAALIGRQLKLPPAIALLGGATIAAGFWARFVLDSDASGQIAMVPILMLLTWAWIEVEQGQGSTWPARLAVASAAAAIGVAYILVAPNVIAAFAGYYAVRFAQRRVSAKTLTGLTFIGLMTAAWIVLTGQADYVAVVIRYGLSNVAAQAQFFPSVYTLVSRSGLAAVWGLPGELIVPQLAGAKAWVVSAVLNTAAAGLALGVVAAAAFVIRRRVGGADLAVLAMAAAGAALAAWFTVNDNLRAAGKAFLYSYPFVSLMPALSLRWASNIFQPRFRTAWFLGILAWFATQPLWSVYLPFSTPADQALQVALNNSPPLVAAKSADYNIEPIMDYLGQHRPRLLLVAVPRTESVQGDSGRNWPFAYYVMLKLAGYNTHFQTGLISDNNPETANLWLRPLDETPDLVLIHRTIDYIGPAQAGQVVAETADLTLYAVDKLDLAWLNEWEAEFETQDADKISQLD
jgi:hypothetical protein